MKIKTRNLSPVEYIEALNKEWWICNFRRKISNVQKERNHYGRIANLKKNRIIDICERNSIPSIFSDKSLMHLLNKSFNKNNGGCPQFDGLTFEDIRNYYSINSDVRCFYGFTIEKKPIIKLGKIEKFNFESLQVEVRFVNGEIEILNSHNVSRIF